MEVVETNNYFWLDIVAGIVIFLIIDKTHDFINIMPFILFYWDINGIVINYQDIFPLFFMLELFLFIFQSFFSYSKSFTILV